MFARNAKFQIGQVVRHRVYPFRGVIFDVDPTFSDTEEWYRSIPQASDEPLRHPQVSDLFEDLKNGVFRFRFLQEH